MSDLIPRFVDWPALLILWCVLAAAGCFLLSAWWDERSLRKRRKSQRHVWRRTP